VAAVPMSHKARWRGRLLVSGILGVRRADDLRVKMRRREAAPRP
jgi:hypothetical protein